MVFLCFVVVGEGYTTELPLRSYFSKRNDFRVTEILPLQSIAIGSLYEKYTVAVPIVREHKEPLLVIFMGFSPFCENTKSI